MNIVLVLALLSADPGTGWEVFNKTAESTEWRDATGQHAIIKFPSGIYHDVWIINGLRQEYETSGYFETFELAADHVSALERGQKQIANTLGAILDGSAFKNDPPKGSVKKHGIPSHWQTTQGTETTPSQTLVSTSGEYKVVRKKQTYTLSVRNGSGFKSLDTPLEEYATLQEAADRAIRDWRQRQETREVKKSDARKATESPAGQGVGQSTDSEKAVEDDPKDAAKSDGGRTLVIEHKGGMKGRSDDHKPIPGVGPTSFSVDDNWELEWDAPGGMGTIWLLTSEGGPPITLGTGDDPLRAKGKKFFEKGGTFGFLIRKRDPWTIRVYQLSEPLVAEQSKGLSPKAAADESDSSTVQQSGAADTKSRGGKRVADRNNDNAPVEARSNPKTMTGEKFFTDRLNPFTESWADLRGTTEQLKVARTSLLKKTNDSFKKVTVTFRFVVRDVVSVTGKTVYQIGCSDLEGAVEVLNVDPTFDRRRGYGFPWHPKSEAEALSVNRGDIVEIVGVPSITADSLTQLSPKAARIIAVRGGLLYLDHYSISIVPKKESDE